MHIRTISVALGFSAVLALTLLLGGIGQDTARGTGGSGLFGDGSDGAITFSSSTQFNPPADAVVDAGPVAGTTLTVSGESGAFVLGQKILIHQTRGGTAALGQPNWELNEVAAYASGNITTTAALAHTYTTSGASAAQVLVVPQYTDVTVNSGVTVSAKAWGGATGGILAFLANGTVTVNGTIASTGKGYLGGTTKSGQGEGTAGPRNTVSVSANGNGGGGGNGNQSTGGGGGSHSTVGGTGTVQGGGSGGVGGLGGGTIGTTDLVSMELGGAGGNGGGSAPQSNGQGGTGGGVVFIAAATIAAAGQITSDGSAGASGSPDIGGGGSGAGGSILIRGQSVLLGAGSATALGSAIQASGKDGASGGVGGNGRIRVEYCDSISGGSSNPPASVAQISCSGKFSATSISITNVYQNPLPKTCFDVMDSGQTFLFSVCDNDFQGAPVSNPACDDGVDTVCNDEDPAEGSVTISVDPAAYHVDVGKVPLNITADTAKGICDGGPTCSLTFTSESLTRPWYPWDVNGDGVVDLLNDILGVIQHYCPNALDPCAKP